MMDAKNLTPAEIERATVEQCAAMATEWGNFLLYDHGGHACLNLAKAIRALPPMFGDVPVGWRFEERGDGLCQRPVGYVGSDVIDHLRSGVRYGGARISPRIDEEDGLVSPIYDAPTAGPAAVRIKELENEKSRAESLLDMWLWETVNQREEHADARKKTQEYFKRAGQAAAKDAQDAALPSSRPDLERVLREWNEATGALPRDSGWFYEVLGMMQDAWDTSAAMSAAPEVK